MKLLYYIIMVGACLLTGGCTVQEDNGVDMKDPSSAHIEGEYAGYWRVEQENGKAAVMKVEKGKFSFSLPPYEQIAAKVVGDAKVDDLTVTSFTANYTLMGQSENSLFYTFTPSDLHFTCTTNGKNYNVTVGFVPRISGQNISYSTATYSRLSGLFQVTMPVICTVVNDNTNKAMAMTLAFVTTKKN